MNEPQKTEEKPTETPAAEPAAAEAGVERKVPESALTKQAADFNAQIAKLTKQVNSQAAADIAAKEAKLKADGDLQKLIDTRDATIKEMADKSTAASRALLEGAAREKLRDLGMTRALSLAGAVAGLPADATAETLEAWVAQVHLANAPEFTAPATPIKSGDAGDPSINAAGADLASRLLSPDNAVRAAAFKEQLQNDLSGGA